MFTVETEDLFWLSLFFSKFPGKLQNLSLSSMQQKALKTIKPKVMAVWLGDRLQRHALMTYCLSSFTTSTCLQLVTSVLSCISYTVPGIVTVGCTGHAMWHHVLLQSAWNRQKQAASFILHSYGSNRHT